MYDSDMMVGECTYPHRKALLQSVHMLIHLNLAISLFLAYLVFAAGAEPGTSSRVSNGRVSAIYC